MSLPLAFSRKPQMLLCMSGCELQSFKPTISAYTNSDVCPVAISGDEFKVRAFVRNPAFGRQESVLLMHLLSADAQHV